MLWSRRELGWRWSFGKTSWGGPGQYPLGCHNGPVVRWSGLGGGEERDDISEKVDQESNFPQSKWPAQMASPVTLTCI